MLKKELKIWLKGKRQKKKIPRKFKKKQIK